MKHQEILKAGTSIWLDDLSRSKLTGSDPHSLPHRITHDGVRGVTTNPSIFGAAITGADEYAADIASLSGKSVEEVVRTLTTDDVRVACDLFAEIYSASKGIDGRVSIEVDPRLAHKTQETINEGIALHALVARPNVMIKVPATKAGLPAITALIGKGISVNVTLIFSCERYSEVIDAFIAGMAQQPTARSRPIRQSRRKGGSESSRRSLQHQQAKDRRGLVDIPCAIYTWPWSIRRPRLA
jgi:transaldolase